MFHFLQSVRQRHQQHQTVSTSDQEMEEEDAPLRNGESQNAQPRDDESQYGQEDSADDADAESLDDDPPASGFINKDDDEEEEEEEEEDEEDITPRQTLQFMWKHVLSETFNMNMEHMPDMPIPTSQEVIMHKARNSTLINTFITALVAVERTENKADANEPNAKRVCDNE